MSLPNFFVIGAPKAGTTALHGALRQHPEIYMPALKEPHFYSRGPSDWGRQRERVVGRLGSTPPRMRSFRRVVDAAEYRALFSGADRQVAIGEASNTYLRSPCAAHRIADEIPNAKIIAVLRHPVERAHSSYWFSVMRCNERNFSFEDALARERLRTPRHAHFGTGLYHAHLSAWYSRFPREQIRIYLYEDWREHAQEMLRDLFAFLEVDENFAPDLREAVVTRAPRSRHLHRLAHTIWVPGLHAFNRRYNLIPPPPMRQETWLELQARYRTDIEQLQPLIDRDLSHWLDPSRCVSRSQPGPDVSPGARYA
jgi:hypothetical protein